MRAFRFQLILSISLVTRIIAQTCSQGRCVQCSPNQYSAGRASCSNCTSDTVQSCNPNNGLATDCFPGNGFDSSSGTCTPSPINSWSNGHNLSVLCTSISIQSCSSTTGAITACNGGYGYSNSTNTCVACIAGTASPANSMLPCSTCSPGQFAGALASNCTACNLDFFSSKSGASTCIACSIGQTASLGSTICSTCNNNTYRSAVNTCSNCMGTGIATCGPVTNAANSCIIGYGLSNGICSACVGGTASPSGATAPCYTCSAGSFSPSNAGVCTPCPADTFAANSGATICSPCDPGKTSIMGSSSCTLCANGTYHSGLSKCSNCLNTGIATCGPVSSKANTCRAGYGLTNGMCIACLSGTSSPEGSSSPCWSCLPGQFSGMLASNCTSCPLNTFSSTTGVTLCSPCNPGAISILPLGSTSCVSCSAGLFASGSNSCDNCLDTGVESCGPVFTAANSCNAGYGLLLGICVGCTGGYFSPQSATTSCSLCPPGSFSSSLSSSCTQCSTNTFAVNPGSSSCFLCSAGLVSTIGATSCILCTPGTYEDVTGVCSNCLTTGVSTCGPRFSTANTCSAGFGLVDGFCTGCIPGFFAIEGNSGLCSSCAPGQYSSASSSTCSACPAGYFGNDWNTTTCSRCPGGQTSPIGSTACTTCDTGSYEIGVNSCASCMGNGTLGILSCGPVYNTANTCIAGYGLVRGICTVCAPGFWSPAGSFVECATCQPGQFSGPGASMCTPCPSNYFSINAGSSNCMACANGMISPIGATSCSSCTSGTYQSGTSGGCLDCMQVGSASCGPSTNTSNTCLAGYGLVSGQCVPCLSGFASRAGSTAECETCPPGSSSQPLSSMCFPCPQNYYALNAGTAACSSCAPGTISPSGSTSCSNCTIGQYQSGGNSCSSCMGNTNSGIMTCGPALNTANTCLAGYGLLHGSCISCIGGFASKAGANVECLTCIPGQYSNPGASICVSSPLDTFTPDFGSPSPTPCDLGKIAPIGSTSCAFCSTGNYKSDVFTCASCMGTGIASCGPIYNSATSCNIGYGLVSGNCNVCISGTAAPAGAVTACQTCPSGTFSLSNAGSCSKCALDYFSSYPGSATCSQCDPGRIAKLGSSICTTCSSGTYHSNLNTCANCMGTGIGTCGPVNSAANSCVIGYGLSNGICSICAGGTASPSGATAPCYTCSAGLFSPPNAGVCTPCPADTFAANPGTTNCSPCDPGQIAISGSTSCTLCQPGTYHDSLDTCSNCLGTGIATCGPVLWAANTCFPGFGLSSGDCIACLGGWSSPGVTAICSICPSGTFAPARAPSCQPCAANYWAAFPGTIDCHPCTPGWISPVGANACTMCKFGTYENGLNSCAPCMNTGVASCGPVVSDANTCIAGYQLVNGACNACVPGAWSPGSTVQCSNCLTSTTTGCAPTTGFATTCISKYAIHNSSPTICSSLIWDACPDTGPSSWPGVYYGGNGASWGDCLASCVRNAGCIAWLWTGTRDASNTLGNCYASNSKPTMIPWTAQITVIQRNQPEVALSGLTASCYTCTTSTCGQCHDHKWYGQDASLTCKDCPDNYSITCDSAVGSSVTCVTNYIAISGICQPRVFARYVAYDAVFQDIQEHSAATELACYVICQQSNVMNGPFQTFTYIHQETACYCKTAAVTAYKTWQQITTRVTSLVGNCATYAGQLSGTCQDVTWDSNGCIGVDKTACFANVT